MTDETKKDVTDVSGDEAGKKPVEKNEEVDTAVAEILEKIPSILEENEKLKQDNENYKAGMLSAKNKLKKLKKDGLIDDDEDDDEQPRLNADEIVSRVVEQIKPLIAQPAKETDALKTKVSELAIAIKNRSQINNAGTGGSGEEPPAPKKEFFTAEQLKALQDRGLDPEKVKENILKYKQKTEI